MMLAIFQQQLAADSGARSREDLGELTSAGFQPCPRDDSMRHPGGVSSVCRSDLVEPLLQSRAGVGLRPVLVLNPRLQREMRHGTGVVGTVRGRPHGRAGRRCGGRATQQSPGSGR